MIGITSYNLTCRFTRFKKEMRETMAKVITVVNQKGGVGKSTISQFTGNELSARGYEVLFIDLDPQGNLSYSLGINILELENNQTIYEPLTN